MLLVFLSSLFIQFYDEEDRRRRTRECCCSWCMLKRQREEEEEVIRWAHQDAWLSHLEGVKTRLTWHFQSTYQSRVLSIPFSFFSRKKKKNESTISDVALFLFFYFFPPYSRSSIYIITFSPSTPSPEKGFSFFLVSPSFAPYFCLSVCSCVPGGRNSIRNMCYIPVCLRLLWYVMGRESAGYTGCRPRGMFYHLFFTFRPGWIFISLLFSFFFLLCRNFLFSAHKRRTFSMDYILYMRLYIYFPYTLNFICCKLFKKSIRGTLVKKEKPPSGWWSSAVVFEVFNFINESKLWERERERERWHAFHFLRRHSLIFPLPRWTCFFRDRFFGAYLIIQHIGMLYGD